ncbi:uncharacterized protein ACBT44_004583 isoform 1-T2 [Syngnathus typhle]
MSFYLAKAVHPRMEARDLEHAKTFIMDERLPSRLKARHPYNIAAQEMLNSIPEDISRDAWLAAAWKQEWEAAGPSLMHSYVWEPGDGAIGGDELPRQQWTTLNRLRTGVGRFNMSSGVWRTVRYASADSPSRQPTTPSTPAPYIDHPQRPASSTWD